MKNVDYMSVAEKAMNQIKKGAFLTVKAEGALNTMTIGWALLGYAWRKPVLMVMVRNTRHTFGIIERAVDFTVTVPTSDMQDAVMFCGTRSGRDVDKFKECDLKIKNAKRVTSPLIDTPGIHFECKIVHRSPMDPKYLIQDYQGLYPAGDYHTLYFGEIMECYER